VIAFSLDEAWLTTGAFKVLPITAAISSKYFWIEPDSEAPETIIRQQSTGIRTARSIENIYRRYSGTFD